MPRSRRTCRNGSHRRRNREELVKSISLGQAGFPDSTTGKETKVIGAAALSVLAGLRRVGRYVIAGKFAGEPNESRRADLNRPWRAVRAAAGLPDLRIHDLRHSAAAVGASAGLSLHQIGNLLGHAQARTTAKYAHLAADPQRRAADLIGN
ncbi:MAG: tyrosine-type recombinase/integrase [Pararhodobacter sp.]